MKLQAILLTVLMMAGGAQAVTYYVDVDYDGSNGASDGTSDQPYTNLQAAASSASTGDTVYVAAGLYISTSEGGYEDFGTEGYDVTITGGAMHWYGGYAGWQGGSGFDWTNQTLPDADNVNTGTMTVIDLTNANSRAFADSASDGKVAFDGFFFRNSDVSTASYDGGALYLNGRLSGAEVDNCVFVNNKTSGDGGAVWMSGRNSTSGNNTFIANEAGGSGGGAAVSGQNITHTLTNCLFKNNSAADDGGGSM
ncbi:MAG: hypothetical protein R6V03_03665 [Kiritimatiellia bacterium]